MCHDRAYKALFSHPLAVRDLLLEFQSSVGWFMALRVQSYAVRLYESLWQGRRPGRDDRLPAVLAVVFYNGRVGWKAATALADLVGAEARPQAGTGPPFAGESYVLVDAGAYAGQELPAGNLVSLVLAAERMAGPGDAAEVLEGALRLTSRQSAVKAMREKTPTYCRNK